MAWDVWCVHVCTPWGRRFNGAAVTRETGYGCLVTSGHHSFPTRSHSPAPPSVASKDGLITVSRGPLSLFNKPSAPQPTAEQPQAGCFAYLTKLLCHPDLSSWSQVGEMMHLIRDMTWRTPVELVPVAWKTLLKGLLPPASGGPQPCVSSPSHHETNQNWDWPPVDFCLQLRSSKEVFMSWNFSWCEEWCLKFTIG